MGEPALNFSDLQFRPLSHDCQRGSFCCGVSDIDSWFKSKALKQHTQLTSRVTTVHFPGNSAPVGFYALTLLLEEESVLGKTKKFLVNCKDRLFPSAHLQFLAVDRSFQGRGLGRFMLASAIRDFSLAAEILGIPFLTVSSIDGATVAFYEKLGFTKIISNHLQPRLLLPAASAIDLRKAFDAISEINS